MALYYSVTLAHELQSLPPELQDEVRAKSKWVHANRDDAALTPVKEREGRKACLVQVKGTLYHIVFDFRKFPPNLYVDSVTPA